MTLRNRSWPAVSQIWSDRHRAASSSWVFTTLNPLPPAAPHTTHLQLHLHAIHIQNFVLK